MKGKSKTTTNQTKKKNKESENKNQKETKPIYSQVKYHAHHLDTIKESINLFNKWSEFCWNHNHKII